MIPRETPLRWSATPIVRSQPASSAPASCTILDRNHVHHGIDVKAILRPRLYTRLDLEDSMWPDDELRLVCDRDTKFAAGDGAVAGFGRRGLELELVSGLDCVDAE